MTDLNQTNPSENNSVNRLHFTVGFLVLTMGAHMSALTIQMLLLR